MTRPHPAFVLAFSLLLFCGCQDPPTKKPPSPPAAPAPLPKGAYPDGPEGLLRFWNDVLSGCKNGQMDQVRRLFASLPMTQEELGGLLGSERTFALWPRYQRLMSVLTQAGPEQLANDLAIRKFDEVLPVRIDEQHPDDWGPTDRQLLKALVRPVPVYSVRIKRDYELSGVRYEFFVYLDGRWRTGGQLAEDLPVPASVPSPAPSR